MQLVNLTFVVNKNRVYELSEAKVEKKTSIRAIGFEM
jgi:hypothetical protein